MQLISLKRFPGYLLQTLRKMPMGSSVRAF